MELNLSLASGDITGDWEGAHNQQLIFADTLKLNPDIITLIKLVFSGMKEHHIGKASSHFEERAKDLGHLVLKSQIYQETRFVRSLLRGITAGLRNWPTMTILLGEEYEDAVL
jgi:hypothetical protein